MKYCSNCGSTLIKNAKYCSKCGDQVFSKKFENDPNSDLKKKAVSNHTNNKPLISEEKIEALEFCFRKHVQSFSIDLWLTNIVTLGLAIIIFPIEIALIVRLRKAKRRVNLLKERLEKDPDLYNRIKTVKAKYSIIRFLNTNPTLYFDDIKISIPRGMVWKSKYRSEENLFNIITK
jgi:uncharacterized membrane protein YvbJ